MIAHYGILASSSTLLEALVSSLGPMLAMTAMNPKFANSHEKRIVKHKNVPNSLKKTRLHRKRGREARTEVIIPLKTGEPISEKACTTLSSREPVAPA